MGAHAGGPGKPLLIAGRSNQTCWPRPLSFVRPLLIPARSNHARVGRRRPFSRRRWRKRIRRRKPPRGGAGLPKRTCWTCPFLAWKPAPDAGTKIPPSVLRWACLLACLLAGFPELSFLRTCNPRPWVFGCVFAENVQSGAIFTEISAGESVPPGGTVWLKDPCLLYTSPSPRDATLSRMPSSA